MHRFRKKSESKRPQLIDDLFDFTPTSPTSTIGPPPALPALSTGLEFRTSLIFPDLTRHFTAAGRTPNVSESKIRSRLAQQRAHGAHEQITEEEEHLMFSALNSIQGFRRRGNSTSSAIEGPIDAQYPESVSSSKSSGPSLGVFPETPMVQESSNYASDSQNSTSPSSRRHSNNLFGSSRFRDVTAMRGVQKNRSLSSANSQDSMRTAALSSENEHTGELNGVPEEPLTDSPSPVRVEAITTQQLGDKDKTPTARTSRLPVAPRLSNGNALTVAQIRRMSMALERAISAIVENEHEADDDEERILAPHSVPLGGAYPTRRPPTAFNDPSHPIEVADLNAVLMFLAETERARESRVDTSVSESSIAAPAPVARTPGYVPGMNRPISPRDLSGHESEDYSTTPRATSPVTPFGKGGHSHGHHGHVLIPASRRQANGNGRPSTAPTRVGMANNSSSSDWQRQGSEISTSGLERSYSSGQKYTGRYHGNDLVTHASALGPQRPSSPLSQTYTPSTTNGSTPARATSLSTSRSAQSAGDEYTSRDAEVRVLQHVQEQQEPEDTHHGLQWEKSITGVVTGPALPDSPLMDEINIPGYFPPIPAAQTWGAEMERSQGESSSQTGILMPQPTAHRPTPRSLAPIIVRSQTPNNIAKTSTPIAVRSTTPPVARVGTPNYLLQRSPSTNGYHLDEQAQETAVRRAISPRPTPSHTPSESSNSAYNPLLHSSMGSSSRSSIGSAGSSYHSSEGETNGKHKEVSNWLFDPESKGSVFVSAKNRAHGESEGSSKDESDSKDEIIDSVGDQEDVLELLTGLTKRDFSTIQQKLVSAAVAREAEEAIRLSQRRRRPSVQSREFVGSPTPKPIAPVNVNTQPDLAPTQLHSPSTSLSANIKRVQSPAPDVRREPEPEVVAVLSEPPLIVPRPLSPVDEPTGDFVDVSEEFKVHSASTTPPLPEVSTQEPTPVDQSPRARALAEALFGSEQVTPAASPPKPSPSAEELQQEIEKKVLAATIALKSPSFNAESNSPLRRKSTKRIDLQKISGPHLVSASMSVDAIPLASPSMASLGTPSPIDGTKGGSKIGDRLRRLRGSLRTKTHAPGGHERESSTSSTVIREPTSSGLAQIVDYDPQAVQTPQIKSVPPHVGSGSMGSPQKAVITQPGLSTPPASASPAGLKGFITRLRQPKGAIKRDDVNPTRPAVSMQPSGFLSSPHLNDGEPTSILNYERAPVAGRENLSVRSLTKDPQEFMTHQGPDEAALRQLFAAAGTLGLDPTALNELLQRTASQSSKPANGIVAGDSRPGTSAHRYEDSSSSSWVMGQLSQTPSRQPSTRTRVEATTRPRPAREGVNPTSMVVRRTIIYPSASPLPGQVRGANVQRKMSTSSNGKRRPISLQSQFSSSKSVHDRVPTPPPSRIAAALRASGDRFIPPLPSSNGRPSTSAGVIYDGQGGSSRQSFDISEDQTYHEDGRALQMVELENGEIIWSVLDTLRDDVEDESHSSYFPSRGSYASQYSGPDEAVQLGFRLGRSTSRAGNNGLNNGGTDDLGPETKVFYSDAKEIARLIGQITSADQGSFTTGRAASTRSSEDIPVEDQLERLLHKLQEGH